MLQPNNYLKLYKDSKDTGQSPQVVTTHGAISYETIQGKQCAYFNNNKNNYLSFEYRNPPQITISHWVYAIDNGSYSTMSLTKTPLPLVWASPVMVPVINNNTVILLAALPNKWTVNIQSNFNYVNKWTHICYVIDQKNYKVQLYINGNLVKEGTGTGIMGPSNLIVIGKAGDDYRAFNGYISEFCVFNRVLNSGEIKDISNGVISSSLNYKTGLEYYGYFNNTEFNEYSSKNISIFQTNSNISGIITTIINSNDRNKFYKDYGFTKTDYIALKLSGFFVPNVTGKWGFILGNFTTKQANDDLSYLWIGNNALNPTTSNYSGLCYWYTNFNQVTIYLNLVQGQYYPLLMYWGQKWGGFGISLGIISPNGSITYDGSQYFKYLSPESKPKLQKLNFATQSSIQS